MADQDKLVQVGMEMVEEPMVQEGNVEEEGAVGGAVELPAVLEAQPQLPEKCASEGPPLQQGRFAPMM